MSDISNLIQALEELARPQGACANARGACRGGQKAREIAREALDAYSQQSESSCRRAGGDEREWVFGEHLETPSDARDEEVVVPKARLIAVEVLRENQVRACREYEQVLVERAEAAEARVRELEGALRGLCDKVDLARRGLAMRQASAKARAALSTTESER